MLKMFGPIPGLTSSWIFKIYHFLTDAEWSQETDWKCTQHRQGAEGQGCHATLYFNNLEHYMRSIATIVQYYGTSAIRVITISCHLLYGHSHVNVVRMSI